MKRVSSPTLIENETQLMMALALLVMVRMLPACWKLAVPCTTVGFVGLAIAAPLKQAATARAIADGRIERACSCFAWPMCCGAGFAIKVPLCLEHDLLLRCPEPISG